MSGQWYVEFLQKLREFRAHCADALRDAHGQRRTRINTQPISRAVEALERHWKKQFPQHTLPHRQDIDRHLRIGEAIDVIDLMTKDIHDAEVKALAALGDTRTPTVLRETLSSAVFFTGDARLDTMLEDSRVKFLNTDPAVRRESLERLWDCWERLKSLENPDNKKLSVASLLSKAADDVAFRDVLDTEAQALTKIGNSFHIRHTEVTQSAVTESAHIDYLFHRLFCMILLLLSKRNARP